jgi:cytochrome c biogenesis protein CcdA
MALSAGLLSAVLTPCLIQLIVIYLATLTGLSAGEVSRNPGRVPVDARRRLLLVSLAFVAGFSILFTAAGALIGYAGQSAQILFADWSRTISISAGVLMIALGIWVGVRAKAPVVCNLPMGSTIERFGPKSTWGAAMMAAGFFAGLHHLLRRGDHRDDADLRGRIGKRITRARLD